MAKSKPLGNKLFSGITGLDMSMNIDIPRAEESANTADVAKPPVTTLDAAAPKEPTEVIAEAAGPNIEQHHSTDTPESPVDETAKATSSRRGRPKKEKNDSAASNEPKYVITTGKAETAIKVDLKFEEKDAIEETGNKLARLYNQRCYRQLRHLVLTSLFSLTYNSYYCKSCGHVWASLPSLDGSPARTQTKCSCGGNAEPLEKVGK